MYLLGQGAHTIGNLWLSHWSDESAEDPEAALIKVMGIYYLLIKAFVLICGTIRLTNFKII